MKPSSDIPSRIIFWVALLFWGAVSAFQIRNLIEGDLSQQEFARGFIYGMAMLGIVVLSIVFLSHHAYVERDPVDNDEPPRKTAIHRTLIAVREYNEDKGYVLLICPGWRAEIPQVLDIGMLPREVQQAIKNGGEYFHCKVDYCAYNDLEFWGTLHDWELE